MAENDHPGDVRNTLRAGSVSGPVIQTGTYLHHEVHNHHPTPPEPAPDTYADVFAALAQVQFTPRPWLTAQLDDYLEREASGYFHIDGKAGTGKTTLAAWLATHRRWPHHFTSGTPTRSLAVSLRRALASQLTGRFGALGGSAETPAAFAVLLDDAGRAAELAGAKAVLVVDGIDKVEPVWGCAAGGLPIHLPRNVYVVATLTEGSEAFERGGGATIAPDVAAGDLRSHIDNALTDPELRQRVAAPEEFRDALARHCAGDFLLLRYLLADIKAGHRDVDDLSGLPGGVWAYYSRWLRDFDHAATAVPVLSTLACLNEPIGLDALCGLSGVDDPAWLSELALTSLQNLVLVTGFHHRDMRLSTWHDKVRDYFTARVPDDVRSGDRNQLVKLGRATDLAVDRIIGRYLGADPDLDGGYGTRHLVRHLANAGRDADLHALLRAEDSTGGNAWFHTRTDSREGYRVDLDIARGVAASAVDTDLAAPRLAPAIGLELRYVLMDASVETTQGLGTAPLAPGVVRSLVARRVWAPMDALREIRAVEDPARVIALVTALLDGAGTLPALDAADAWNLVFPPRAVGGFETAARLLPMIADPDRTRIRGELHRLSRIPEMPLRARMLGVLAACEDADTLLDAALTCGDDERTTADAIADLLPHLSPAALDRAHTWITTHPVHRRGMARAHRALAIRHAELGTHPDWLADHVAAELAALAADGLGLVIGAEPPLSAPGVADGFGVVGSEGSLSARGVSGVVGSEGPLSASGAADGLGRVVGAGSRPPALLAALDPARRDRALTRVLDRIAEEPPWGVALRLTHIGRYLSGPPLDRALRMARAIRSAPGARARALAALLPALDPREQAAAVKDALSAPPDRDTTGRADTIAMLAAHPANQADQVERAVRTLPQADQPGPLAALARHSRPELRGEAVGLAAGLTGPSRAVALVAIAPHLDRHTRGRALALVDDIPDPRHRAQALDALTGTAREEDLHHALSAARVVDDRKAQALALAALAHHVATTDVPALRRAVESRAVTDLVATTDVPALRRGVESRVTADHVTTADVLRRGVESRVPADHVATTDVPALRRGVEPRVTADHVTTADVLRRGVESRVPADHVTTADVPALRRGVESRVPADSDALVHLAPVLPPAEGHALLRRVAEALPLRRPLSDYGYFARLAAIRPVLTPKETLARLEAAAEWRPSPGWDGLTIWTTLNPTPDLVRAARKALRRKVTGAHERAQWIAALAPHLADPELDEHLDAAAALPEVVRHLPLAALARRLDPDRRAWAIGESLADMCREDRPHPRGPASIPVGLDPHSVALIAQATRDHTALLDAVLPRIGTTRRPWTLFALLLPHLSTQDQKRVESVAIERLAAHIPDPANDCAVIARHTGPAFHRALIEARRVEGEDARAKAHAAVLAADPTMDWEGVCDLLAGLSRPGLLTALAAAAPRIGAVGGHAAVRECATAIEDVSRWWP